MKYNKELLYKREDGDEYPETVICYRGAFDGTQYGTMVEERFILSMTRNLKRQLQRNWKDRYQVYGSYGDRFAWEGCDEP